MSKTIDKFEPHQVREKERKVYRTNVGDKNTFKLHPATDEMLQHNLETENEIEKETQKRVAELSIKTEVEAFQKGFQLGKEEGHQKAYQEFKIEAVQKLENFKAFLLEAENLRSQIIESQLEGIEQSILDCLKRMLLKEVKADREYVHRVLKEMIQEIKPREFIRIQIHPDQQAMLKEVDPTWAEKLMSSVSVKVETNADLELQECRMETESVSATNTIDWNKVNL